MSDDRHDDVAPAADSAAAATTKAPTDAELDAMSRNELFELGTNLDGVDVVYRRDRWPIRATRAERRAERGIAAWFLLSAISGLAFIGIFLFWPWQYKGREDDGYGLYSITTPLYGITLGISILSIGIALALLRKRFIPEEISVQERHGGRSDEVDRKTLVAILGDALHTSTIARRKVIVRTGALGLSVMGLGAGMAFLGGLIKNPWAQGAKSALWVTGWTPNYAGEEIFLRRDTGRPEDVVLVRPEDLDAGGMETVFPFRESERGDHEKLLEGLRAPRNAVMLIRLRTHDSQTALKRKGQESFNYGDYWAYSKICTHLGCPTSLYEQQTNRILCPCHQSQFSATHWGKPVFGPAARALPQLPITVNKDGFLVANGDYIEAVGPAFWERRP